MNDIQTVLNYIKQHRLFWNSTEGRWVSYNTYAAFTDEQLLNQIFKKMKNNSIKVIQAYLWNNIYVFDEETLGLVKETFVGGSTELIGDACGWKEQVTLVFSDKPFPDYTLSTEFVLQDEGGTTYFCEQQNKQHWLCNVLLMYFDGAPKTIYVQVK